MTARCRRWLLSLVLLLALAPAAQAAEVVHEAVYVAGNPDLYPLEWYDEDSGAYRGVLPDLLERIGGQIGLTFQYVQPGAADRREDLSLNQQVEVVSGLTAQEGQDWQLTKRTAPLLHIPYQDGRVAVSFGFTSVAGGELESLLTQALTQVSDQELLDLVLNYAGGTPPTATHYPLLLLAGILVVLLTATAWFLLRYRRRLHRSEDQRQTDPATGLGNLTYLEKYFEQFIHDKNRVLYCLVYFELNMEQLHRRLTPDELSMTLRYLANQFNERCGDTDILACISDGTFVILRLSPNREDLTRWLEPLFRHIRENDPTRDSGGLLRLHAGYYFLTDQDHALTTILFNAEQGCRLAARTGQDFAEAGADLLSSASQQRQYLRETATALEADQFKLFLQPIATGQGKVYGAEVLTRWQHPTRGLLSPVQFIGLMEQEGTIDQLDYYMLEHTLQLLERLDQAGMGDVFLSCNFSRQSLDSASYWEHAAPILERYAFQRDRLVIEVTESLISESPDIRQNNLDHLRSAGAALALDDFGSGYTSFQDLAAHNYDYVKLDRSLLKRMDAPYGRQVLSGLIDFCHGLDFRVLCEGVETPAQLQTLQDLGCDLLQGYYLFRPLPVEEAWNVFAQQFQAGAPS